jgi:tetratricopeptide (TPR) repeat protein
LQRLVDEEDFDAADEIVGKLSQGFSTRGGAVSYLSPTQRFIIMESRVKTLLGKTRQLLLEGRYSAADALVNDGMDKIVVPTVSVENPLFSQALKLVADVHVSKSEFSPAKEKYLRAMQLLTDTLGPDSMFLVDVMVALADLSKIQALYAEAEALYTQAMHIVIAEIQRDPSPQPKPDAEAPTLYAKALLGISELFLVRNQFDSAASTLAQAKLVCEGMTGKKLAYRSRYLELTGLVLVTQGDLTGADEIFEQCLQILRTCFPSMSGNGGIAHPLIGRIISRQASVSLVRNDFAGCQKLCDDATATLLATFSPKQEQLLYVAFIQACKDLYMGEFDGSKSRLVDILNTSRKLFGGRHPFVGEITNKIGDNLLGRGDIKEAQLQYEDAKKIFQELFDSDGWNYHISIATSLLGKCRLLRLFIFVF